MKKPVALLFIMAVGALALALVIGRARANPGALDPTWGDEGLSQMSLTESDDLSTAALLDADGKVVNVGWVNGYPGEFGLARMRPDGSLDPTFGEEGIVMTRFSTDPELPNSPWSIGPRPNGGYLVAGEICDVDYVVCEWVAAAYNHDGTLDETFDDDGWITVTVPGAAGVYAWPPDNVLQPDGKIIVGGIVVQPDDDIDLALRRHNTDGALDEDFGDGGIVVYDFDGEGNYVENLLLLPDDKILVVGGSGEVIDPFTYTIGSGFLLRLNSDGSLDDTFGDGGKVAWDNDGAGVGPEDLVVTDAGDMFVTGVLGVPADGTQDCGVWRFDGDGNMDMEFGDAGLLRIDTGRDDSCTSLALLPDGKLAISGFVAPQAEERQANSTRMRDRSTNADRSAQAGETEDALVVRVNADGALDETFGDSGMLVYDIDGSDNNGPVTAAQPDGKILVFGNVFDAETETLDFAISRFLGDGPAARVFLPVIVGGQTGTAVDLEDAAIQAVARQQGIPAARLAIANSATADYPVSGVQAHAFKVEDSATGDLFGVTLDAGGAVLDEAALDAAEVAAYQARYGVLEQSLAELIESGAAPESLPLVIWLKEPEYVAPARADADSSATPRSAAEMDAFLAMVDARRADAVAAVSAPVLSRMSGMGLSAEGDRFAPVIYAQLSMAQLGQIAEWPEVDRIYLDGHDQPSVNIARQVVRANVVNSRGFSGSGVRVAQIEAQGGRVATSNPYLSGIVQNTTYVCSTAGSHATGVAGIIRSTHSTTRGAAPAALLWAGGSCSGNRTETQNRASAAVSWGARALNLSFGSDTGRVVGNSTNDRFYDNLSMTTFRSVVVSSGNNASPCAPGNGNVGSPGLAYNVITVGNFNDQNTLSWTGDTFSGTCSSFVDPISTKSDREKPEVAAPGTSILSTTTASPWTGNIGSGTSYSAPLVTGVAALMMQRHTSLQSWPEVVKAILMATATHNIEGSARLSEYDGAGAILADRADDVSRGVNGGWAGRAYSCSTATNYDVITMSLVAGVRTRVVITWNNPSTYASYTTKPSADLDLTILNPSGLGVTGSASWDNNYEIVDFTPSVSGTYKVRVRKLRCDASPAYLGVAWARGS